MAAHTFQQPPSNKALIRRRQVEQLVQLSRSTIYAAVKSQTFPAPYRIGARAVAWRVSEVEMARSAAPGQRDGLSKGKQP